jgi:predicted phage terminase large subunit-like protein
VALSAEDAAALDPAWIAAGDARKRWIIQARTQKRRGKQLPPRDLAWQILLFVAGRGFGKTVSQVQWAWWEAWRVPNLIVHAIGPTLSDVRGTIFEGPAGFNTTIPAECLLGGSLDRAYNKTLHELRLSNGSLIRGFGAQEEAGRLRGPQCHCLIADELREWDRPAGNLELAMNNALFGLRLPYPDGTPSRAVMGTTPKTIPYLKRFEKRAGVRVVRGTSHENMENLAEVFRTQLLTLAGTLLGKQEIEGLFTDDEGDLSILKRRWLRLWPVDPATGRPRKLPELSFILEVLDSAASEENYSNKKQETDPSASIVLGVFNVAQCFDEKERREMGVRGRYAALLLDCWSERLGLPDLLDKMRKQHRTKWGPVNRGRRADVVLIENKSSGPGVRQFMTTWGVPTWPYNPRGDKTMRLHAVSPLINQGMLWVPESGRPDRKGLPMDWCEEFIDQITAFAGPGSVVHDDYVDCLSSGFTYLRDRGLLEAKPLVEFLDREEKIAAEQAEAVRIRESERAREHASPYGA